MGARLVLVGVVCTSILSLVCRQHILTISCNILIEGPQWIQQTEIKEIILFFLADKNISTPIFKTVVDVKSFNSFSRILVVRESSFCKICFFALKYILKVNSNESINKVAMGPEHKKQQKHPKSLTVKIESVLVV